MKTANSALNLPTTTQTRTLIPFFPKEEILADAKKQAAQGILRYSIVTAGKALSDAEIDIMCGTIRQIRQETTLSVCVSFGLLTESQFRRLKDAGVSRVHNNLETSERHFPNICTTHTFADKMSAIQGSTASRADRLQRWHHGYG